MPQSTTQSFLEFKEIKQGVVILRSNALRGLLMVSSINFDLKSEEEQNSIVFQFQSFVNSLDFSCQIVAQSRRLNITGYFDTTGFEAKRYVARIDISYGGGITSKLVAIYINESTTKIYRTYIIIAIIIALAIIAIITYLIWKVRNLEHKNEKKK